MAGKEVWITEIAELVVEGEGFRLVLASGAKSIVLRGSRNSLVRVLGLGNAALKAINIAEVVPFEPH